MGMQKHLKTYNSAAKKWKTYYKILENKKKRGGKETII